MSHYFAVPSAGSSRSISVRASQYQKPSKRKRQSDTFEDEDDNDGSVIHEAKILSPGEAEQYKTAGLNAHEEIPPGPFPHAPVRIAKPPKATERNLRKELAELDPPLYAPSAAPIAELTRHGTDNTNIKQHHLAVLTTILHKSLHEGDYIRAGRAWALLLRSEVENKPFNVRRDGRWGIGAEILLQNNPYVDGNQISINEQGQRSTGSDSERPLFSPEGFEAARNYYDRLIVQFDNRKLTGSVHGRRVNATQFFPAMFSLWIYEVLENSKRLRYELSGKSSGPPSPMFPSDRSSRSASEPKHELDDSKDHEKQIQQAELAGAREISEKLDRLVESPPNDKHVQLLHLSGMIHLWIKDLSSRISKTETSENLSGIERSKQKQRALLLKAISRFERAEELGNPAYAQLNLIRAELDEDEDSLYE